MITPLLEKMILNGWAQYRVINNAYGSFEKIEVPKQSFAVIVQIIWNHFTNPIKDYNQAITWGEYFKFNEYQLKIATDVKTDFYQFRNSIKWTNNNQLNPIRLDQAISNITFERYFIQEPNPLPIILNTYLTANEFIELNVIRNAFVSKVVGTYGVMPSVSNQQNAPAGLGDSNVILNLTMQTPNLTTELYAPPGLKNAVIPAPTPRQKIEYINDVSKADVNSYESNLQNLDTTSVTSTATNPTANFPLITLGIVIVNKNHFDKLSP